MLWEDVDLKADDYGAVLLMLSASGVLFLSEHTELGRRWVMPMRLPEATPPSLLTTWASLPQGQKLTLCYSLRIAPPGLVERLMASCYGLGYYHQFWRRGALIRAKAVENCAMLIEMRRPPLTPPPPPPPHSPRRSTPRTTPTRAPPAPRRRRRCTTSCASCAARSTRTTSWRSCSCKCASAPIGSSPTFRGWRHRGYCHWPGRRLAAVSIERQRRRRPLLGHQHKPAQRARGSRRSGRGSEGTARGRVGKCVGSRSDGRERTGTLPIPLPRRAQVWASDRGAHGAA